MKSCYKKRWFKAARIVKFMMIGNHKLSVILEYERIPQNLEIKTGWDLIEEESYLDIKDGNFCGWIHNKREEEVWYSTKELWLVEENCEHSIVSDVVFKNNFFWLDDSIDLIESHCVSFEPPRRSVNA